MTRNAVPHGPTTPLSDEQPHPGTRGTSGQGVAAEGRAGGPTEGEIEAAAWLSPGRRSGEPCVYGTRLPTEMVARAVWTRMPVDTVCASWDVTRAQVLGACWYEARYGRKRWPRRWGEWADANRTAMWYGDWGTVTEPPTRGRT